MTQQLEKSYRGVYPTSSYTSLGFVPTEYKKYYHPTITKYCTEGSVPCPEDLLLYLQFLLIYVKH